MGVGVEVDLLVVRVAEPAERLLADAGPGGRAAEQPDDRRALGAAEAGVAPGDHVGRDAALPVGRPGQRDERRIAGDVVLDLDGIADGEDVRVAGAHLVVDAGSRRARRSRARPSSPARSPGARRCRGPRCRPGWPVPDSREDLERAAGSLPEAADVVVECEPDAVLRQMALDVARHLRVHRRHELTPALDQRHLEAEMDHVLRHLEADEAAADHDRALRRHDRLESRVGVHARRVSDVAFDPLADHLDVRHGPHPKDARQVDAGQGRAGSAPRRGRGRACRRTRWSPRRSRRCADPRSSAPARSRSPRTGCAPRRRAARGTARASASTRLDSRGITPPT